MLRKIGLFFCWLSFHAYRRTGEPGQWAGAMAAYPWKCKRCGQEDWDIF